MGNLYYNVLGNVLLTGKVETGPFSNIDGAYWSATELAPDPSGAWYYNITSGTQGWAHKDTVFNVWAVQSGDVELSAVPVPAAVWLFGSGLIGLLGLTRRNRI